MNTKLMRTLEKDVYAELKALAMERGVTVQEFLRAVVIPDWMQVSTAKSEGVPTVSTWTVPLSFD